MMMRGFLAGLLAAASVCGVAFSAAADSDCKQAGVGLVCRGKLAFWVGVAETMEAITAQFQQNKTTRLSSGAELRPGQCMLKQRGWKVGDPSQLEVIRKTQNVLAYAILARFIADESAVMELSALKCDKAFRALEPNAGQLRVSFPKFVTPGTALAKPIAENRRK